MTAEEYIAKQEPGRRELLSSIHHIILKTNKKLSVKVAKMMGSDMIQYSINSYFGYALDSGKNHMTLHLLPMYMHKPIHEKYSKLISKAKFQKGCINFKNATEMPLALTEEILADCAKVDLVGIMEKRKKK